MKGITLQQNEADISHFKLHYLYRGEKIAAPVSISSSSSSSSSYEDSSSQKSGYMEIIVLSELLECLFGGGKSAVYLSSEMTSGMPEELERAFGDLGFTPSDDNRYVRYADTEGEKS